MTPNPFLSIWTEPRRTVRKITIERPSYLVWPLAILAGINDSLHRAFNNHALHRASNDHHATPSPWLTVAAAAVVIGALWGPFSVWFGAYLLRWTGYLMDGGASLRRLRTALAWAAVPSLVGLLLWVPRLLCFGTRAFTGGPLRYGGSPTDQTLFSVLNLIDLVLAFWSTVLLCNTVAEVQGFRSAWQGVANFVLAGIAVAVPLTIILVVGLMTAHGRL